MRFSLVALCASYLLVSECVALFVNHESGTLLRAINGLRSKAAAGSTRGVNNRLLPEAANMNEIRWDFGLGKLAQSWANECEIDFASLSWRTRKWNRNYGEDADFKYDKDQTFIGQTVAIAPFPHFDRDMSTFREMVDSWYDESRCYDYETNTCDPRAAPDRCPNGCDNYLQLVHAQTRYVGCGENTCRDDDFQSWMVFVCMWYSGDYKIDVPYLEGKACAACDLDQVKCTDKLCSGCHAPKFTYCQDYALKCKTIKEECPDDCQDGSNNRNAHLCDECRDTCGTCTRTDLMDCVEEQSWQPTPEPEEDD